MKKYKIGYTTGVYDMFHIGHLNLLKKAKAHCEMLVVGVSTDELVMDYKKKMPVISYENRVAIVEAIKYVDKVVPQESMDKLAAARSVNADVVFVGDDWKGTAKWNKIEKKLKEYNIDVVYFPYTLGVSSTVLASVEEKRVDG